MKTGDRAPDLTFTNTDGTPRRLADFRGRPLLLVFLRHLA